MCSLSIETRGRTASAWVSDRRGAKALWVGLSDYQDIRDCEGHRALCTTFCTVCCLAEPRFSAAPTHPTRHTMGDTYAGPCSCLLNCLRGWREREALRRHTEFLRQGASKKPREHTNILEMLRIAALPSYLPRCLLSWADVHVSLFAWSCASLAFYEGHDLLGWVFRQCRYERFHSSVCSWCIAADNNNYYCSL